MCDVEISDIDFLVSGCYQNQPYSNLPNAIIIEKKNNERHEIQYFFLFRLPWNYAHVDFFIFK